MLVFAHCGHNAKQYRVIQERWGKIQHVTLPTNTNIFIKNALSEIKH